MIKKNTLIIFFILNLINLSKELEEIKNQEEHFKNIFSKDYLVAFLYNKKTFENFSFLKEIIDEIKNDYYLEKKMINLELIDFGDLPFFKNHFKLEEKSYFQIFIKNQRRNFDKFDNLLKKGDKKLIKKEILEFLKFYLDNIINEIRDFENLLKILKAKKIISIYLGEPNNHFYKYYTLAQKNLDYNFFFSHEKKIKKKIFEYFSKIENSNDNFVILRDDTLIDEFDNQKLVYFSDFKNDFRIKRFFNSEIHPKLRLNNYHKTNIPDLYLKNQMIFIFFENEKEEEKKKKFLNSIKKMPKEFIFTYINLDKKESSSYLQLLMENGVRFNKGNLFIFSILPSLNINIEQFKGDFNENSIIEFGKNFLDKYPYLYLGEKFVNQLNRGEEL